MKHLTFDRKTKTLWLADGYNGHTMPYDTKPINYDKTAVQLKCKTNLYNKWVSLYDLKLVDFNDRLSFNPQLFRLINQCKK